MRAPETLFLPASGPAAAPSAARIATGSLLQPDGEVGPLAEQGSAADELHLALFLLLSGFFALLLAFAQPAPERARAVLDSLVAAFSVAGPSVGAGGALSRVESSDGPRRRAQLTLGEPLTAAERAGGLVARVRVLGDRLFTDQGDIGRWHWFLLRRLALRASAAPDGQRLEILVPEAAWRQATEVTRKRLEALVTRLVAFGASRERLFVGLRPETAEIWTFLLREPPEGSPP